MRIGILTHHYISNYGAFLQAYALQSRLSEMYPGSEVLVIDLVNTKHSLINRAGFFRYYRGVESLGNWFDKQRQPAMFKKIIKDKLNLTRRVRTADDIVALNLDCVVIGSDEVWNYEDRKSLGMVKFGEGLAKRGMKVVSYAPSVGRVSDFSNVPEDIAKAIRENFDSISVRDSNTQKLVEASGYQGPCTLVLDPTFMYPLKGEVTDRVRKMIEKPYILFYHCDGMQESQYREIAQKAKEKGLVLLGGGENNRSFEVNTASLTPFEWMSLFANAQEVYTGTFHGVVFSILNRKQFSLHISIESRKQKIRMLLDEFEIDPGREIDYDKVYKIIDDLREQSSAFLESAIGRSV